MIYSKIKEFNGHSSGVYALDVSFGFIYSGSADRFVARWKIEEGIQDTFSIRTETPVYSVKLFDQQNKLAIGLSSGDLHIIDLIAKKEIKFVTQHRKAIFSMEENKQNRHLYVSDADGNLSVWDTQNLELLAYLPFDCGKIRRLSVHATGTQLALACQDGCIRILNSENLNLECEFFAHQDGVCSLVFDPIHGDVLFSGGKDAYLRKWNFTNGQMIKEIPAHHYAIYDLITLLEGKYLVSASRDKTIKVWESDTLSFIQKMDFKHAGHKHSVNTLKKWNEYQFFSASDDKKIILWSN